MFEMFCRCSRCKLTSFSRWVACHGHGRCCHISAQWWPYICSVLAIYLLSHILYVPLCSPHLGSSFIGHCCLVAISARCCHGYSFPSKLELYCSTLRQLISVKEVLQYTAISSRCCHGYSFVSGHFYIALPYLSNVPDSPKQSTGLVYGHFYCHTFCLKMSYPTLLIRQAMMPLTSRGDLDLI